MIVAIFRSRLQQEHREEYSEVSERMESLAKKMPGFVSFKTFKADDGERVSIVEFKNQERHNT